MWIIFLLVNLVVVRGNPDPCNRYSTLNDHGRHSLAIKQPTDKLLCDRTLKEGWYRFHNADMPFNQCRKMYQCSTHIPLWVNGTIPSVSDNVVSRTVCGNTGSDCCHVKTPIYIKNCGQYIVYYLRPTPACSMAYCTGDPLNCGPGQYSLTGFKPCRVGYPHILGKPILSKPIITNNGFEFTCQVPYPRNKMDATFTVTWYLDGKPISGTRTKLSGQERVARLQGYKLPGNLNKDLACAVTTSFTDGHTGGMTSPKSNSNKYWVGMKVSTRSITLDENHPTQHVSLTSTIPIVCSVPGHTTCSLDFKLTYSTGILSTQPCEVKLTPTTWNPVISTAVTTFTVTTNPSLIPFQQTSLIKLTIHSNGTYMYVGQTLPNVQVHQTSTHPSALCISTGDPHVKTFDNKNRRYDNFLHGQFTMVQRRSSSFRVEARTWKCGRAACNCAVAMREGNDVITVDMCHSQYGKGVANLEIRNPSMYENKTRIAIEPSGNAYVVSFDSGAIVKITTRHGRSLDIFITVPGTFYTDTEGLCGYFDGMYGNDFTRKGGHVDSYNKRPNQFIRSWSIPRGQSLFEKADPLPSTYNKIQITCTHNNNKPNPMTNLCPTCVQIHPTLPTPATTSAGPVTTAASSVTTTTPAPYTTSTATQPSVTTTQTTILSSTTPYNFVTSGPNPTSDLTPMVDIQNATSRCNHILQKYPSARMCNASGFYVDYSIIMNMCVADIQMTNDNDMAISSLSALLQQCAHEILIHTATIQNGSMVFPAQALSCLGACSGNGDCQAGVCVCDAGFTASDCSVNTQQPPTLTDVLKNPCDVNTEKCFEPILIGSNMLNSPDSKCYVKEISQPTSQNSGKRGYAYQQPVQGSTQFYSTNHVLCHMLKPNTAPAMTQFAITLSNNQTQPQSNTIIYNVYNSKCQQCDTNFNCTTKVGTCKINNQCFMKGDKNPNNTQESCDPDKDQTVWTSIGSGTGTANIYTLPIILPDLSTSPTTAKAGQGNSNILTLPPILPAVSTAPSTPKPAGNGNSQILTLPPIFPGVSNPPSTSKPAGNGNSQVLTLPPIFPGFGGNVNYTKSHTGCECDFDNTRTDCACCQNFGCQCPQNKRDFCYDCLDTTTCGN